MSFRSLSSLRCIAPLALVILAGLNSAALAHVGTHTAGFAGGLAHPFLGLDHVVAMVAVGLWASQLGRPAYWALPLTFPLVMALGAAIAASGLTLPWAEAGIAGSVLVLGVAIAFAARPTIAISVALISAFALFHGYGHGVELTPSASPLAYGLGFIAATLALHAVGLAIGALANRPAGRLAMRGAGAVIAAAGIVLMATT
jgi:urease accessory protein